MTNDDVYTENYKGFEIEIYQEQYVENPWRDQDGLPPLAVLSFDYGRSTIDTEDYDDYGEVNEIPTLSRAEIMENRADILSLLDEKSFFRVIDRYQLRDYSAEDLVNEAIEDHVNGLGNQDRLQALADLYQMIGWPALLKSVHGYCQGDYWEVLAVATPVWKKVCGIEDYPAEKIMESLKGGIQLFEDWATGNVYGYSVEDADGEFVDGCGWFFGDYDAEYGPLSEAKSAVDHEIERRRKAHTEQVKTWIKNRVPLYARTA